MCRLPGVELPGASRPRTPARGVCARGVLLVPLGRFLMIFQIFEKMKIFKKYFYRFLENNQKMLKNHPRTCPDDAQNMSG